MGQLRLHRLFHFVYNNRVSLESCYIVRCQNSFRYSSLNGSSPVRLAYDNVDAKADGNDLPPLVILHGLFGSKRNWRALAKTFNEETGRRIITPDARNHGDSGRSTKMSFFLQALDVHHLIQELQLSKVVLLANSMGAKTAMTFALSYPASLDSLITVDISPWPKRQTLAEKHLPQIVAALRAMDLSLIKDRRDADKILMDVLPIELLRSYYLLNLVKTESGFQWKIDLEALENNLPELLRFPTKFPYQEFDGRVLFVGGSESDYIREEDYPDIYKLFPKAEIKFIPDSRHWLVVEKPEEFAQLVTEFLKECVLDQKNPSQ